MLNISTRVGVFETNSSSTITVSYYEPENLEELEDYGKIKPVKTTDGLEWLFDYEDLPKQSPRTDLVEELSKLINRRIIFIPMKSSHPNGKILFPYLTEDTTYSVNHIPITKGKVFDLSNITSTRLKFYSVLYSFLPNVPFFCLKGAEISMFHNRNCEDIIAFIDKMGKDEAKEAIEKLLPAKSIASGEFAFAAMEYGYISLLLELFRKNISHPDLYFFAISIYQWLDLISSMDIVDSDEDVLLIPYMYTDEDYMKSDTSLPKYYLPYLFLSSCTESYQDQPYDSNLYFIVKEHRPKIVGKIITSPNYLVNSKRL